MYKIISIKSIVETAQNFRKFHCNIAVSDIIYDCIYNSKNWDKDGYFLFSPLEELADFERVKEEMILINKYHDPYFMDYLNGCIHSIKYFMEEWNLKGDVIIDTTGYVHKNGGHPKDGEF